VDRALGGFGDSDLEASALEESDFVASAFDPSAFDPSAFDPSAFDPSALDPSAFGGSGFVCGGAGGGGGAAGWVGTGSGGVVAGWGCTDDGGVAAGWVCSTGAWASCGAGGWVDGFSCAAAISEPPNAADINSTQSCCRLTNPSSVRNPMRRPSHRQKQNRLSPFSDRSGSQQIKRPAYPWPAYWTAPIVSGLHLNRVRKRCRTISYTICVVTVFTEPVKRSMPALRGPTLCFG
jgi:hypothetical protein